MHGEKLEIIYFLKIKLQRQKFDFRLIFVIIILMIAIFLLKNMWTMDEMKDIHSYPYKVAQENIVKDIHPIQQSNNAKNVIEVKTSTKAKIEKIISKSVKSKNIPPKKTSS